MNDPSGPDIFRDARYCAKSGVFPPRSKMTLSTSVSYFTGFSATTTSPSERCGCSVSVSQARKVAGAEAAYVTNYILRGDDSIGYNVHCHSDFGPWSEATFRQMLIDRYKVPKEVVDEKELLMVNYLYSASYDWHFY